MPLPHRQNSRGDNYKGGSTMTEIIFALSFLACLSTNPEPGLKEGPPKCIQTHDLKVVPPELQQRNLECFAKVGKDSIPVQCPWEKK